MPNLIGRLAGVLLATTVAIQANAQDVLDSVVVIPGGSDSRVSRIADDFEVVSGDGIEQVGYDMCQACRPEGCGPPWWAHRTGVFGDFLLLRPSNTDVLYAVEQNDVVANSFPTGPTGITQIGANAGYRVGFVLANTNTTSLVASFTHWEGNTSDRITRNGTNVLVSQIIHPSPQVVGPPSAGATSLQTRGEASMEFSSIDAAYRHKLFCTDTTIFNWSGGFRYASMEQSFREQQEVAVATGLVNAVTDIDFDGFGFTFGLDAERRSYKTGMLCYTKGAAAFLGGEWTGSYRQTNQLGGGVIANDFEDFRITPVFETELGVGWQNDSGCIRATCGYMAQFWCNAMNTRAYVDGVRTSQFVNNLDETIGFIGLTSRLEVRF